MRRYSINCKGQLLTFEQARIMGVLNLTSDSYYAASRAQKDVDILNKTEQLLTAGADIIDIGGVSTRPGASEVDLQEETQKITTATSLIRQHFPTAILSVDTFRSQVAEEALNAGADIINDISAYQFDPELLPVLAKHKTPYILSYSNSSFQNMHQVYLGANIIEAHLQFLSSKIKELQAHGIKDIIIDPGFGFGKDLKQNWELIKSLKSFQLLSAPIMIGISRKSMLYKLFKQKPEDMLPATSALHLHALQNGANILRVHDPLEAQQVVKMFELLKS